MIVNQFFKTSPSLQADSTTISFFHHQHPTSPPSQHHNLTNGQRSLFYADYRDNRADNQNKKINGFYSIPEMILVIIYPNSKFRSSLGLEKSRTNTVNFEIFFRSKFSPKTKLNKPKQSLKCPLNVTEVCTGFPVVLRKESRHSESESKRAMTGDIGTQYSGPYGRWRAV